MKKNIKNSYSTEGSGKPDDELHANSAYSGSGSMQPGGATGQPGKPNDYPDDKSEARHRKTDRLDENNEVTDESSSGKAVDFKKGI